MQNKIIQKKKKFIPAAFKVLVAMSSFAGTIGMWNYLSNKDLINASANNDQPQGLAGSQTLPPIPTLVPLIVVNQVSTSNLSGQNLSTSTTTLRSVQAPSQTIISQPATSGSPVVIPAPVTITRSSK